MSGRTKTCVRCSVAKPLSSFGNDRRAKDGLKSWCRECYASYSSDRQQQKRSIGNASFRSVELVRKYGITLIQYFMILDEQLGECAICRKKSSRSLHVDHDHGCCPGVRSCGLCVRELLCSNCNTAIGLLGDDPEILENALTYILTHKEKTHEREF